MFILDAKVKTLLVWIVPTCSNFCKDYLGFIFHTVISTVYSVRIKIHLTKTKHREKQILHYRPTGK